MLRILSCLLQVKAEKPAWYLAVISGALIRCQDYVNSLSTEYLGYLEKGQLPPARLTLTAFQDSLILDGRWTSLEGNLISLKLLMDVLFYIWNLCISLGPLG